MLQKNFDKTSNNYGFVYNTFCELEKTEQKRIIEYIEEIRAKLEMKNISINSILLNKDGIEVTLLIGHFFVNRKRL